MLFHIYINRAADVGNIDTVTNNHKLTQSDMVITLTSSDPVSEGLAFLGAMTGESDPSKSN